MKIAFRVDAAPWIGSGHVMRCLTLAVALAEAGHSCVFICAYLNASLKEKILSHGFECCHLPFRADVVFTEKQKKQQHAAWLGADPFLDAKQTITLIEGMAIDWLVVDHYGLEAEWHRLVSGYCKKIMVIDDLADRSYFCHLLLDQNYGRSANDYCDYVTASTELLMGLDFCLLRAQFLPANRYRIPSRVLDQPPQKILLSFGGVDQDNYTFKALTTIINSGYLKRNSSAEIVILMGSQYPHGDSLNAFIATQKINVRPPINITVYNNIDNVATLMMSCELAIGACGSTVWELCCLGVPALLVATANNQQAVLAQLNAAGIVMALEADEFELQLGHALNKNDLCRQLNRLSQSAISTVDGQGTWRVIKKMEALCGG